MGSRKRVAHYLNPIPGLTLMGENGITQRRWAETVVAAALVADGERDPKRIADLTKLIVNELYGNETEESTD